MSGVTMKQEKFTGETEEVSVWVQDGNSIFKVLSERNAPNFIVFEEMTFARYEGKIIVPLTNRYCILNRKYIKCFYKSLTRKYKIKEVVFVQQYNFLIFKDHHGKFVLAHKFINSDDAKLAFKDADNVDEKKKRSEGADKIDVKVKELNDEDEEEEDHVKEDIKVELQELREAKRIEQLAKKEQSQITGMIEKDLSELYKRPMYGRPSFISSIEEQADGLLSDFAMAGAGSSPKLSSRHNESIEFF